MGTERGNPQQYSQVKYFSIYYSNNSTDWFYRKSLNLFS